MNRRRNKDRRQKGAWTRPASPLPDAYSGSVPQESLLRATAFLERSIDMAADSVRAIEGGAVALTPSLPSVWSLNHLRLSAPMACGHVLQMAQEHLTTLPFRHVVADTDAIGQPLAQPLQREGFSIEREVVMTMTGRPQSRTLQASVSEPGEQAMLALERRWIAEDRRLTDEVVEQILEATRREGRAWGERRFAVTGEDGSPVAMSKLRCDKATAQVEDVYTAPEYRGKGLASALVTHAVSVAQQAGHDVVFILADDDDWPKHLYARLGFTPMGRRWVFHKDVG
jgi:GNAT superfamily N-acetyltransferase